MDFLTQLWLPILLSAVAVFLMSAVVHMVLKYHYKDFAAMPNQDAIMSAMRDGGVAPGEYTLPYCGDMKQLAEPEMQAKFQAGPVAYVTVIASGVPQIGPGLIKWFLYSVVISFVAAYVGWHAVGGAGADFAAAMRFTGTVAFAMYGVAYVHSSIWKGLNWGVTLRFVFDGLIYALATGAVFGWLWPGGI